MQGWRTSMEDSHTHILSLPDDPATSFFAVFGETISLWKMSKSIVVSSNN